MLTGIQKGMFLISALVVGLPSFANTVPASIALSGQLFAPDESPVVAPSVNFHVQVFDNSERCVLYEETFPNLDLGASVGRFSLTLGAGTGAVNNVSGSGALDVSVFKNSGVTAVANCTQATVDLSAGGARQIHVSYDLGAGYTALTPGVTLASSAYALVAETLQGKTAADFIQVDSTGSTALSQTNASYAFSSVNWPRLKALLDGTSGQYLSNAPSVSIDANNQRIVDLADPTAPQDAVTKRYADTTLTGYAADLTSIGLLRGDQNVLLWDAHAQKWVAGPMNASPTGAAGGALTGTYPNPGLANDVIKSANISSSGGGMSRLLITDNLTGDGLKFGTCAMNEVYAWGAAGWACTAVSALAPVTSVAGRTGAVTLTAADIQFLGTAALFDWGTSANQIVRLDASARLPAVDGSLLQNVNALQIQSRAVASTAPSVGQVLGWNGTAWTPVPGSAGSVTNVASGTGLLGGPITSTGTLSVDVGTGANQIPQLNATAQLPAIDGSLLTNVNATAIATRPVANVAPTNGQVLGWNAVAGRWEPTAGNASSVTQVNSGAGLLGGPITSTGTLSVDTGTTAAKIVQLDGSARLPGVDASLLTNVNASRIGTRAITSNAPAAGQVLAWNQTTTQWEPFTPAAGSVTSVGTGTGLLGGPITSSGSLSVDVGSAANKIVQENANAQIAQTLGSVGAPAYSFAGDTDTGVYSPGPNQLSLVTGGGAGLTLLANGNVGVGSASPTSKLEVQGTVVSRTNVVAIGATIDLARANTHLVRAPGSSTLTLLNPADGASYTIIVTDVANSRTYTFAGCTNQYFSPSNAPTVSGARSTYTLLIVNDGGNTDCYVSWATGFM